MTRERYQQFKDDEQAKLSGAHLAEAAQILDDLVTQSDFAEFLTLPAYEKLG
jgi:malate synthase